MEEAAPVRPKDGEARIRDEIRLENLRDGTDLLGRRLDLLAGLRPPLLLV